ncbi:MAG: hypothetical protein H7Z17_13945 [Fuerstia sp.]|nr:hypothetical protein [Fuerstiella sp.]
MESPATSDQPQPARGAAWTLIGGIAVFVAILLSVYGYVIPRIGQEPISATATLEFRESSAEPHDAWSEMTLPDRTMRFVSQSVTLKARDFQAFRNRRNAEPPEITLILSAAGRSHVQKLKQQPKFSTFVVMLHGKALTEVSPTQWAETQTTLLLKGMSHADAHEVMARLTE